MRARQDVSLWGEKRTPPSAAQWQGAVDALRSALLLTPADPTLQDHLGLAYDLAAAAPAARQWPVYREFALLHFREAARLRPTSPYSWANVAQMKYRLGQHDAELARALSLAMRYGPWEPLVQLIASDIGLALWDRLEPALRGELRENWRRTALRQAEALARLGQAHRREKLLCEEALDVLGNRLKCPNRWPR